MKIGNKYLYGNGRGNYYPKGLFLHGKDKHGINAHDCIRKGLNSKLRHIAKRNIIIELNS